MLAEELGAVSQPMVTSAESIFFLLLEESKDCVNRQEPWSTGGTPPPSGKQKSWITKEELRANCLEKVTMQVSPHGEDFQTF